ncbi:E3 ubiquitin-protein ligase PRT6 isoform X1 [Typha angustifolia]|uniref:E3 ubiquitin-protein ligase PRT6 isoform X1 n=1 Tax=Typha angustifolia TaxID=59011 RepID=UPI003C2EFE22
MAGMEVDLLSDEGAVFSPNDHIVQKLVQHGVPQELLSQFQPGLVHFAKENKSKIPEMASCIIMAAADILEARRLSKKESGGGLSRPLVKDVYGVSLLWLQWLMFEGDPQAVLKDLAQKSVGQRGVCGSVWGQNDLAYRCRTCELDPTCAICVPCFQNGDHKDHDYSIMYTGGGCCDCGDVTAWKRKGFCSKHKGAEQIQPLPGELANSVGPVLDALLRYWKDKVCLAEVPPHSRGDRTDLSAQIGNELTTATVGMLLEFCKYSESLLSFISKRMYECGDLLDVLMRTERFLDKKVVKKLHELLLKLLGEPLFKYEFAKAFTRYYPITVHELIEKGSDTMMENYPLLTTFSVQIFTVPTLTSRIVHEVNLLAVLIGCLRDIFLSCVEDAGHLQANKWANLYETTIRLVEDIRYVLSHEEVAKYIAHERTDISRSWLKLLRIVQGMDTQKRVTGLHAEDENENLHGPFVLGQYLGNVHNLLVQGAFSAVESKELMVDTLCTSAAYLEDNDNQRRAKVGRFSKECFSGNVSNRDKVRSSEGRDISAVPYPALWLIFECLKAIECWLVPDVVLRSEPSSFEASSSSCHNLLHLRKKLFRIKEGTNCSKAYRADMDLDQDLNISNRTGVPGYPFEGCISSLLTDKGKMLFQNGNLLVGDMCSEDSLKCHSSDDNLMDVDPREEAEGLSTLNMADWPEIVFDVSSQEISFHIPLHRLLSLLLRKAMKTCYDEAENLEKPKSISTLSSAVHHDFFCQVLGSFQPSGFSASLMEHPLRLRVFCAQVRAGMWRKNGDAAILSSEWYRSVQWFEQGLESDLFLLQCCAALAPPELFVKTIQERFGLSNYTSLSLVEHNEYEPVLVQEMLTLIIQIVKERRFCGLSSVDNLRRELVYKLSVGDATRSQLVKSLPRDLSKSNQLQNVLDMVAVYSNPSGMKQAKYSLRESYWKELDLYHPRWNSRDLQVAEERYFRFCKASALNVQLPRWTNVFDPLSNISKIATSKGVLNIVCAVLFYAVYGDTSSASLAPDGVLITALHLVSLALDICDSKSQMRMDQYATDVLQYDNESCEVPSHYAKDFFPILTYASGEFIAGSDIGQNQNMLSLLVLLMHKYKEENDSNCSVSRYCNISTLIEALLKKFAMLSNECMVTLKQMVPALVSSMPEPSSAVRNSASTSNSAERKAKARERQAAIMEKMRAEQSKFIASLESLGKEGSDIPTSEKEISNLDIDVQEDSIPVCSLCRDSDSRSPLCYLILLQKSRLVSFVERGPPSWEDGGKSDKGFGSAIKEDVLNPFAADSSSSMELQSGQDTGTEFSIDTEPAEVDAFLDFLNERLPNIRNIQLPSVYSNANTISNLSLEMMEDEIYQSVVRELNNSESRSDFPDGDKPSTSNTAVGSKKTRNTKCSVLGAYVACLSRDISKRHSSVYGLQHFTDVSSKPSASTRKCNGFGPNDCDGIHISTCGHAVHQDCHDRYLLSLKQRNIRRLGFEGGHIIDPDLGELLCPVCRRFANSILPASSNFSNKSWNKPMFSSDNSARVIASSSSSGSILHIPLALSLLDSAAKMVGQERILKLFSGKLNETVEAALDPSLRKLSMLYYPQSYGSLSASERLSHSLLLWDTLRYSLISTEIAARGRMKTSSTSSKSYLESLYGELNSPSGFILSLLLRVAQSARNSNRLEVLLRFRGIQLLTGSICSGISGDCDLSNTTKRRGKLSSIIEHAKEGDFYPDIQFWKQSADPILAQDPFTSLMWVLFCLPLKFLSSSDSLISIVHLFYGVCVVQALITFYCQDSFEISSFSSYPLSDVCKTMTQSEPVRQYFLSNHIDSFCHPKDMLRRFTFPYLRRCALLWKLLRSSTVAPLYDRSNMWERSILRVNNGIVGASSSLAVELNGIRELEDMFQIQSLELVLKDEVLHDLTLKWCQHFCEEFRVRRHRAALFPTPAVPFKLMQLPPLYQDLLQRYVKMRCSDCNSVPDEPALCLLCGKLCSPSWKSCCRASKCLNHAAVCGAGIGVFLLVRKTTILLQRSARQASWPSPYLDAFGEEDHEMCRGKPLYLSEERYAALTYLVASHSLDRTSEVLRQTTIGLYGSD